MIIIKQKFSSSRILLSGYSFDAGWDIVAIPFQDSLRIEFIKQDSLAVWVNFFAHFLVNSSASQLIQSFDYRLR